MKLFIIKVISKLLLPPGLFLILAAIVFVLSFENKGRYSFHQNKKKYLYFFLVLLLLTIYIFSSYFGEFALVKPLEGNFTPLSAVDLSSDDDRAKTAIVVLGGGVVRGTPTGSEVGRTTLKRLYKGWQLHKKTGLDLVVSGGVVPGATDSPVANVMKKVLLSWGVPEDEVILEKKSKNTWQNAVNTTVMLEKADYERIVLVTSATHMQRAVYSFKKNGEAQVVAAPTDYILDTDTSLLDFLPNRNSLNNSLTAFHEWVGLAWYYFK